MAMTIDASGGAARRSMPTKAATCSGLAMLGRNNITLPTSPSAIRRSSSSGASVPSKPTDSSWPQARARRRAAAAVEAASEDVAPRSFEETFEDPFEDPFDDPFDDAIAAS
jgi:hypothetical protein